MLNWCPCLLKINQPKHTNMLLFKKFNDILVCIFVLDEFTFFNKVRFLAAYDEAHTADSHSTTLKLKSFSILQISIIFSMLRFINLSSNTVFKIWPENISNSRCINIFPRNNCCWNNIVSSSGVPILGHTIQVCGNQCLKISIDYLYVRFSSMPNLQYNQ